MVSLSVLCGGMVDLYLEGVNSYALMALAQSFMIIPLIAGLVILKRTDTYLRLKEDLGFNGFNPALMFLLLVMPGATSVFSGLVQLPFTEKLIEIFGTQADIPCPETVESFLWLFLSLCVLAPVFEEIIFRGIIMRLLLPYGTLASVIVSAVGFSMLHFAPAVLIAIFVIGIVLGFIRVYTNSIWSCILFHSVFNFLSLMQIVFGKELESMWFITAIYAFVMICLFPILFFILYKTSKFKKLEKGYIKWKGNGIIPILLNVAIYGAVAFFTAIAI